jgi:hypothetical protein
MPTQQAMPVCKFMIQNPSPGLRAGLCLLAALAMLAPAVKAAEGVELLEDPQFAQGFGAGWYYGLQRDNGPTRLRVAETGYRDISPLKVNLIPDGPVAPESTKNYPWDFEEGLHHDFTNSEGKRVKELHEHRFVVNHKLEANRPDLLQFAQFNNQGLKRDSPERDKKLVKRITSNRKDSIRVYYNSQNDLRNVATNYIPKFARDTWPHLLLNQVVKNQPKMADFERIDLSFDFKVGRLKQLSTWPEGIKDAGSSAMNLKFMLFLRQIEHPERALFVGMMLQTSKPDHYKEHFALEQHGTAFYRESITKYQDVPKIGQRYTVRREIKDLLRQALAKCHALDPDLPTDPDAYYLSIFSLGWEGLGHWDAEFDLHNLSLKGVPRVP